MSLNTGGNIAHCFYLFFNEHEDRVKTAQILRLFFNEHELYSKTARYTSHKIRNVSCETPIFIELAPHISYAPSHPFFMQVRNQLIPKTDK